MTVYDFRANTINGEEKSLADYNGCVLLIVNTASQCGFTPQFARLQKLYETYQEQGFEVLGFPCNQFKKQDPGSNTEIAEFCQTNYGVTFQMFQKVDVKGAHIHPLFAYLTRKAPGMITSQIKWNFTKFLINRNGEVVNRFAPQTKPDRLVNEIELLLKRSS